MNLSTSSLPLIATVNVPGSMMLLGEHAVLYEKPSFCLAIDQYISIKIYRRPDDLVMIHSAEFGKYQTTVNSIDIKPPLTFILAAIKHFQWQLTSGFLLEVDSDFSPNLGFGSSAAVTVATLMSMAKLVDQSLTEQQLIKIARQIIRSQQQGLGSGADVAASVLGGIVYYQTTPLTHLKLIASLPIVVVYSGYKKSTTSIIKPLFDAYRQDKNKRQWLDNLYDQISLSVLYGYQHIINQDFQALGDVLNQQQQCLVKLGVSNQHLDCIINQLRNIPDVYGAKISGAGLGDCLIAIANPDHLPQFYPDEQLKAKGVRQIKVGVSAVGACYVS